MVAVTVFAYDESWTAQKNPSGRCHSCRCGAAPARCSSRANFASNDKYNFNPFVASGSIGMRIDEFNGDNFDHGPLGFFGGGYLGQVQTNGRPMEDGRGAARHAHLGWGSKPRQLSEYRLLRSRSGSIPPRRGHDEER
jgi:hypothetical protein